MRTRPSKESSLLDWALEYGRLGWPVLPLAERSKVPLTRNGLLDASDHPQIIEAWWSARPTANIGLRTGETFDVIDVDGDEGETSLSQAAGSEWRHSGPVSLTGKGRHLLIQPTQSRNKAGLLPKLDFRGKNGYIVAPPSIHPSGSQYQWDSTRDYHTALPKAEKWLTQMLDPYRPPAPVIIIAHPSYGGEAIIDFAVSQGWEMKKEGNEFAVHCPLGTHEDTTASFKINPVKNKWYCHGCNRGGGSVKWLRVLLSKK